MVGHDRLTEWIISAQNDVTAVLPPHAKTNPAQSSDDLLP